MKLLSFFRLAPDGEVRYGSTKVSEIEAILLANGGMREKMLHGSEYEYTWKCQGWTIHVDYRCGDKGLAYMWMG